MKRTTHIQNLAAGASLFMLAAGFSLLGSLALASNNSWLANRSTEPGVRVASGVASLGVGQVFLLAALLYCRGYANHRPTHSTQDVIPLPLPTAAQDAKHQNAAKTREPSEHSTPRHLLT
jgi:hypothetical protein